MAHRILTAAALLVALAAPALAEEISNGSPLVVPAGQGTVIQAAGPVGNVFIANPNIADVQVPPGGGNLVYVFAKAPGRTSLYALGGDGEVVLNRTVDVSGPRTVRVLHGRREVIWSEVHGEPNNSGRNIDDLPAGSAVIMPVGQPR